MPDACGWPVKDADDITWFCELPALHAQPHAVPVGYGSVNDRSVRMVRCVCGRLKQDGFICDFCYSIEAER